MAPIRVCVIGGGTAGLCAVRHLTSKPDVYDVDAFEKTGNIGGLWVYTPETHTDEFGLPVHSSMYRDLRTNLQNESMQYPDFPFKESDSSYPHRSQVLKYIHDYARHYKIDDKIQLFTPVTNVEPKTTDQNNVVWNSTYTNLKTKETKTKEYDAVFVCNGHHSAPHIPAVKDIEKYEGTISHSHNYRVPEIYKNKSVIVLGASYSGIDIAFEVSAHANQVYLSHNLPKPLPDVFDENVKQVPGIASAFNNGFILNDGSTIMADSLIYCTGYEYSFPFLSPNCGIKASFEKVEPLYKHVVNVEYPSMFIIGMPFIVLPYPLFHFQVQYCMKILEKDITLPSKEEMKADIENDYKKRLNMGWPTHHTHKLGDFMWDYFDELAGKQNCLPAYYKLLYDSNFRRRMEELKFYKSDDYKVLKEDEVTVKFYGAKEYTTL